MDGKSFALITEGVSEHQIIKHILQRYLDEVRRDLTVGKPGKLHVDIECFYPKYNIPYIKEVKLQLVNAESSAK